MKNYTCEPCQYETKYKQDLNKHVKTKHHLLKVNGKSWEKKTHTCKKCEYVTQYKSDLDKHIKRVHNNKINVKYLCLACCEYIETTRDHDAHLANKTHRKNVITNMSHHGEFYKLNNINNMANVYKEPLFMKKVNLTINKKDIDKVDKKTIDKYEKENSLLTDEKLLKMYNKRSNNNLKEYIIAEYGKYLNHEERCKVHAEEKKYKVKLEDDSEEEISIRKYKVNKVKSEYKLDEESEESEESEQEEPIKKFKMNGKNLMSDDSELEELEESKEEEEKEIKCITTKDFDKSLFNIDYCKKNQFDIKKVCKLITKTRDIIEKYDKDCIIDFEILSVNDILRNYKEEYDLYTKNKLKNEYYECPILEDMYFEEYNKCKKIMTNEDILNKLYIKW